MIENLILISLMICCVASNGAKLREEKFYGKCVETLYRECTHKQAFSEEEIENAKIYIQKRFLSLTKYRPVRPPCKKLHVRKDFKCLTHDERLQVVSVLRKLFDTGFMAEMARIHWQYWGNVHKFIEFIPWHRWFQHHLEVHMKKINKEVTLPYWSNFEEYDQPHLSLIWDYFGKGGDRFNDHCIKDSVFANLTTCVRREWTDQLIPSWNPIEFVDSLLQTVETLPDWFRLMNDPHLKVHLNVGGWMGQMSVTDAPYDPIFYPLHEWLIEIAFFKWQLQSDSNLIPESYNGALIYDAALNRIRRSNLNRDRLTYFNVSVLEAFQVGFGELCYINDDNIRVINQLIKEERNAIPVQYNRLPEHILEKYYPKFFADNYTALHLVSNPVVNCNRRCRPIAHPLDFLSTLNGRRLLRMYRTAAGLDLSDNIVDMEFEHNEFIADMNSVGYCSPYIIS